MNEGELVLIVGVLLAAGLVASLAAGRLRMPGLVLVLGVGMLIGSDGLGWIDFDDFELARQAGIVAVAMILFEGAIPAALLALAVQGAFDLAERFLVPQGLRL